MLTIGERIRIRRIELGLSQEELAQRANYSGKPAISKFENAGNDITIKQIYRLAPALDTTVAYLMGWESPDIVVNKPISDENANITLVRKALDYYDMYINAPPEIRSAIDVLLKTANSD